MLKEEVNTSTGKARGEVELADIESCRQRIEECGLIREKYIGNRVVRYVIAVKGNLVDVRTFPGKVVMLSNSIAAIRKLHQIVIEPDALENAI